MAPVELVGFTGSKTQPDVGCSRRYAALLWANCCRNAGQHRIHRRSRALAALRTAGSVSDVRVTPSLRSPTAIDRACPATDQSLEVVAPLAHSETRSLPIG